MDNPKHVAYLDGLPSTSPLMRARSVSLKGDIWTAHNSSRRTNARHLLEEQLCLSHTQVMGVVGE